MSKNSKRKGGKDGPSASSTNTFSSSFDKHLEYRGDAKICDVALDTTEYAAWTDLNQHQNNRRQLGGYGYGNQGYRNPTEVAGLVNPASKKEENTDTTETRYMRVLCVSSDSGMSSDQSLSRASLAHGQGVLSRNGEVVYSGSWENGLRHGEGSGVATSRKEEGGRQRSDRYSSCSGVGSPNCVESGEYRGAWRHGSRHGQGLFVTNSFTYEGEWQDDLRHGKGTERASDNTAYKGTWSHGQRHGCGTLTWSNGAKELREYERGELIARQPFSTVTASRTAAISADSDAQDGSAAAQELEAARARIEELEQAVTCQICFETPRDCLVMPCMHLLYCSTCVAEHKEKHGTCPCCRGPIAGMMQCVLKNQ